MYWEVARRLESGALKRELGAWWLAHIEARVVGHLCARGFDPAALPERYCDLPPTAPAAAEANLCLLQALLARGDGDSDSDGDGNGGGEASRLRVELVAPLLAEVYARVDEFVLVAEMFLACERHSGSGGKEDDERRRQRWQ
jgi:hypothetical protein